MDFRHQIIQVVVVLWILVAKALAATNEGDVSGLQAISRGWQGVTLNWTGNDPCGDRWQGISCENVNVTAIDLSDVGIRGRLLGSIGNLVHLKHLVLAFNPDLGGPLPSNIGRLVNLEYLSLQSCGFSGPIPSEIGDLKKLTFLGLNSNKLTGTIPPQLGGLRNVTWFDLSENQLSGELPVSTGPAGMGLDNITAAVHFHLNNNSFTGSFPPEITVLPNLIHLLLDSNDMSGPIPAELGNMKALEILRLDNNKFTGAFPNISNVKTLQEVHIRNNSFTIFPDFSSLTNLLFLSLGMNNFPPQFVSAFSTLVNLQSLEMDNANLIGGLPSSLLSLPGIESLSFVSNKLNGSLDLGGASQSLAVLNLDNNEFNGLNRAPSNAFFQISLRGNPVCNSRNANPSYVNCTSSDSLSEVWVPSGNCTSRSTCSGDEVFNQASCSCGMPYLLTFQFNAPTFSTMTMEREEQLRGELAKGAQVDKSQVWINSITFTDNFRFNAIVAFFPPRGSRTLPDDKKASILNTYVLHLVDLVGFDPYHVFPFNAESRARSSSHTGLKAGAIAGICVAVVLIALAIGYAVRQRLRAKKAAQASNPFASWGGGKDNGGAPVIKGVRSFTFADLRKATNNFSDSYEIGVGGYGKVYKGYLLSGEVVAIKRAQAGSMQGAHEFKTEIELLSRLHHKNLVGLVGFCFEQGEQMLVYEYMPNGTIRDHLLDHSKILSWTKRLEISVGAARGLSYLHELANPPIIHRDIKSSNILLDEMFIAKVADLGLSKISMADEGKTHVSTQVKGTLGYLDPEYYMTQQLTDKSDVYSFGVVLLELLTARPPIEDGKYVVREMRNALSRGGLDAVIPLLDSSLEGYNMKDLRRFLSLALACVEEAAYKRPSMNEVVKELEGIVASASSSNGGEFHSVDLYEDPAVVGSGPFEYSGGYTVPTKVEPK